MKLIILVSPMGAVRMTQRGKWANEAAQRYLDYKTVVGWEAKKQMRLETPIKTAVRISQITFVMPIPKDGKSQRKIDGKRVVKRVKPGDFYTGKPDIDNLFKGVTDSLNGIIWADDSLICEVGQQIKIYGETPRIEIEIHEVGA